MNNEKRRDDGMAQRRKVLGDAWVDKSAANMNSFNADFIDLITRYAWADIWTRPHFDERTRRILVIGSLVALCQWDEFRLHVRAALTEMCEGRRSFAELRDAGVGHLLCQMSFGWLDHERIKRSMRCMWVSVGSE